MLQPLEHDATCRVLHGLRPKVREPLGDRIRIHELAHRWGSLQQPRGYTTIPRTTTTLFDIATRNLMQADFSKALRLT